MVYLLGVVYLPEVALTDEAPILRAADRVKESLFSPVAKKEASELFHRRPHY